MKFSFVNFLFLSWSGTILSSFASAPEETSVDPLSYFAASEPIFSRTCSLVSDANNSYLIAMLNIFYSVPVIQKAFYAEADAILSACTDNECRKEKLKTSLIVATAGVFAHMRMSDVPLSFNSFYYGALKKTYGRPYDNQYLFLVPFLEAFLKRLPTSITSLVKYQSLFTNIKSDGNSKQIPITEYMILKFPFYPKVLSISQYLDNSSTIPYSIKFGRKGTILAGMTVSSFSEIVNSNEVFMIEIPRLKRTEADERFSVFNTRKITVDIKITVNDVDYVLVSYSSFDFGLMEFSSVTRDFGNQAMYEMRNGKISAPLNTFPLDGFEDGDSVLLVYAREDTLLQINRDWTNPFSDIPNSIKSTLKSFMAPLVDAQCYEKAQTEAELFHEQLFDTVPDFDFEITAPDLAPDDSETLPYSVFEVFDADSRKFSVPSFEVIGSEVPIILEPDNPYELKPFIHPQHNLISPAESSSIGAILIAFYNIPDLQDAFYTDGINSGHTTGERNIAVDNAVADAFARMRLNNEKVNIEGNLLEAISTGLEFDVSGMLVRLSPFYVKISKLFGSKVKENLEIDCVSKVLNASNSKQIVKSLRRSVYSVPLPIGDTPRSVAYYLQHELSEPTKTVQTTDPKSYDLIDTYPAIKINKISKYFCIDIPRVKYERTATGNHGISFENNPIFIDSEIKINGAGYILVARIEFNPITSTYSTIMRDFRAKKTYQFFHDGTVHLLHNATFAKFADEKSTFLIYAEKKNYHLSFDNAEENLPKLAKTTLKVFDELQSNTNRKKRKLEEIEEQIYQPDSSKFADNTREHFPAVERKISDMKAGNIPFEGLNFISKYLYGTFVLGSEDYSFKQYSEKYANSFYGLKLLLLQMASSIRFVKALFAFVGEKPQRSLEISLAVVITRMLMGCKNIPLDDFFYEILIKSGRSASFFEIPRGDQARLNIVFRAVIDLIDPSLISLPKLKYISYFDLNTSDPETINIQKYHSFTATNVITPSPAAIRGAWFDTTDRISQSIRIRSIYASSAEIFPVEIVRTTSEPTRIEAQSMDRDTDGFICMSNSNNSFSSYALDKFSGKYRALIPGGQVISINNDNIVEMTKIQKYQVYNSVQLFMSLKCDDIEIVYSAVIPKQIIESAIQQILAQSHKNRNK